MPERKPVDNSDDAAFKRVVGYFLGHEKPKDEKPKARKRKPKKHSTKAKKRA